MRRFALFSLRALVPLALFGCSSGGFDVASTDAASDGSVTVDQACTDLATARCNKWSACSKIYIETQFGDLTTCIGREKQICVNGHGAPGSGNSADGAERCAATYATQTCADLLDDIPTAACTSAPGSEADGAPCVFSQQCAHSFCALPKDAQCGTCSTVPPVGASCTNMNCAPGQLCPSSTHTCAALGQNGAPCDRATPCASGLTCVGATATAQGTCVPSATTVGAPCDPSRKSGPDCDRNAGVGCDLVTSKCVPVQLVNPGDPCDDEVTFCGGGGTCFFAPGAKIGTCQAAAPDGGACDTALGPSCLNPSRCIRSGAGTAGTCFFQNATSCM